MLYAPFPVSFSCISCIWLDVIPIVRACTVLRYRDTSLPSSASVSHLSRSSNPDSLHRRFGERQSRSLLDHIYGYSESKLLGHRPLPVERCPKSAPIGLHLRLPSSFVIILLSSDFHQWLTMAALVRTWIQARLAQKHECKSLPHRVQASWLVWERREGTHLKDKGDGDRKRNTSLV
jgi:hypothetical protein